MLTQRVPHLVSFPAYLEHYYQELMDKGGAGRARAALICQLCALMIRILLSGEKC